MTVQELLAAYAAGERNFDGADLMEADLSGADLSGAFLSGAFLNQAQLSGANLSGAELSGAELNGANLSGANLSGATLRSANLNEANLSEADLRRANLTAANLSEAELSGADFSEANLRGANLNEANLSGAIGARLDKDQLSAAKSNRDINSYVAPNGEIVSIIQQQIEQYDQDVKVSQFGTVLQVEDGIALIYGLEQVIDGELIEFEDGTFGIAQDLEEDIVRVVLMGEGHDVQEGSPVTLKRKSYGSF